MDLLEKAWEGRVEFESFEHYVFEVTTQYAPLEITVEAIDDGVSTHRSVPHLYVSTCSELSTQRPSVRSALPRANYEAPFADKRTPSTQYSAMGIVRRPGSGKHPSARRAASPRASPGNVGPQSVPSQRGSSSPRRAGGGVNGPGGSSAGAQPGGSLTARPSRHAGGGVRTAPSNSPRPHMARSSQFPPGTGLRLAALPNQGCPSSSYSPRASQPVTPPPPPADWDNDGQTDHVGGDSTGGKPAGGVDGALSNLRSVGGDEKGQAGGKKSKQTVAEKAAALAFTSPSICHRAVVAYMSRQRAVENAFLHSHDGHAAKLTEYIPDHVYMPGQSAEGFCDDEGGSSEGRDPMESLSIATWSSTSNGTNRVVIDGSDFRSKKQGGDRQGQFFIGVYGSLSGKFRLHVRTGSWDPMTDQPLHNHGYWIHRDKGVSFNGVFKNGSPYDGQATWIHLESGVNAAATARNVAAAAAQAADRAVGQSRESAEQAEKEAVEGASNGGAAKHNAYNQEFEGTYKDGMPWDGTGRWIAGPGRSFEGTWEGGKPHDGDGEWRNGRGCCFSGKYSCGLPVFGDGIWYPVDADGPPDAEFKGSFADGAPLTGSGVWYNANTDRYEGEWVDGDGNGSIQWARGDSYSGQWHTTLNHSDLTVHVLPEGDGVTKEREGNEYSGKYKAGDLLDAKSSRITFAAGDVYRGEVRHRVPNGPIGTMIYATGDVYIGPWQDGKRNGKDGEQKYANGDRYYGDWQGGKRHNMGSMTYAAEGTVFKGMFKDDKRADMHASMSYKDGSKYDGEWNHELEEGQGQLESASGEKFKGYWRRGVIRSDKEGMIQYVAGNTKKLFRYDGLVKDGEPWGDGQMEYENGDRYVGQWKTGKRHGYGCMSYGMQQDRYDGYWANDMKNGDGVQSYGNGDQYTGLWRNDVRAGWGSCVFAHHPHIKKCSGFYMDNGKEEVLACHHFGAFVNGIHKHATHELVMPLAHILSLAHHSASLCLLCLSLPLFLKQVEKGRDASKWWDGSNEELRFSDVMNSQEPKPAYRSQYMINSTSGSDLGFQN